MPVAKYVEGIRRQILDTSHVVSHSLGYEDRPPLAAIVRGSVTFADGSYIHFKEFLQLRPVITRLKPTLFMRVRNETAETPCETGAWSGEGGKHT